MLLTIETRDASPLRTLLDRFALEGVTYTEQPHWLFWRRFRLSGPKESVSTAADLARQLKWDSWLHRVTPGKSYEA